MDERTDAVLPADLIARAGTPGPVPYTSALRLTLRSYLLAVALYRQDAHTVLAHLGVASLGELDDYSQICTESRLIQVDNTLSPDGWRVVQAIKPWP